MTSSIVTTTYRYKRPGDVGVQQWIRQLPELGEVVVDPSAGTGRLGKITWEKGRHWIDCDVVEGGSTTVRCEGMGLV